MPHAAQRALLVPRVSTLAHRRLLLLPPPLLLRPQQFRSTNLRGLVGALWNIASHEMRRSLASRGSRRAGAAAKNPADDEAHRAPDPTPQASPWAHGARSCCTRCENWGGGYKTCSTSVDASISERDQLVGAPQRPSRAVHHVAVVENKKRTIDRISRVETVTDGGQRGRESEREREKVCGGSRTDP